VTGLSDDELVHRTIAGETHAFEEIVRRHQEALWRIACVLLRDGPSTEQIVQDCFVAAFEQLRRFSPGRDLGRWLRGIARHRVREELRRTARERARLQRYRHYLASLRPEDALEAERWAAIERALVRCREALAPAAARAVTLRYDEALTLPEVAARLGRSVTATRQLLYRARETLRACVEKALAG
jgi:RNA polymerase sigma-70 factor (ECF subfamily)